MAGFNDTIENVYSFPFTANSLITFDLVHIIPQQNQQTMNRINTKPEHSAFINFVPGEQGGNGGRTYNFKNKIALKYSLQELEGLSYVLRNNAETGGQATNPYRKFSNSQQGGQKSVSVWQGSQMKQVSGKEINVRTIFIQANAGQQKVSISMTPEQAYATSSALHEMYLKGTHLEIDRMMNAPRISNNNQNNNQTQGGFVAQEPLASQQQQVSQNTMNSDISNAIDAFGGMIDNNPF